MSQLEPKPGQVGNQPPAPHKSFWTVSRKLLVSSVAMVFVIALGLIGYLAYFIIRGNQEESARDLSRMEVTIQGTLRDYQNLALGLATEMSSNPQVQAAFAAQDRQLLTDLALPAYVITKQQFNVKQFQFIVPPGTSFLRLHQLDKFGDDLTPFRATVVAANATQSPVRGIEIGRGGLGVRGEAPVVYKSKYIGVVDVGLDIGELFLYTLKQQYGIDAQIMLEKKAAEVATFAGATGTTAGPIPDLVYQAGTFPEPVFTQPGVYNKVLNNEKTLSRVTSQDRTYSVISVPLTNYSGQVIGVMDIFMDRTDIIATQSRNLILVVVISVFVTLLSAFILTRAVNYTIGPIGVLTNAATAMAGGNLDQRVTVNTQDEFSVLANAFNNMTGRLRDLLTTLEHRVEQRTKALADVAEIGTVAANIQDEQEMLATVVHLVQRRFGLYHAHVFAYNGDVDELQIVACGYKEGDEHEGTHGTATIPLDQERSLVARAGRTRQPVIVNDVRSDPGWLPNPLLPDTASELAVPLLVGDKLIGVLDVQSEKVDAFTDADADVQMTLASQVAVASQNLRQFQVSQKMATDLGVVATVGLATSNITEANKLLQEVVDLTKKSFDLYHAHIYMLNEEDNTLDLTAGAGEVGRLMVAEKRRIPFESEQSLVARAARTRIGVVVNDVRAAPDFLPNPLLPDTRAEMAVPMIASGQVIGVLDVQANTINRFTEIDVNIKTTLAAQIAVAVQNARSFTQAQVRAERETILNQIAQKIQSAATVEAAMQTAARELGRALGMHPTVVRLDRDALVSTAKGE